MLLNKVFPAVYVGGMQTQNHIKRTLCRPEAIEQIRQLLDGTDNLNRTALADQLCERFRLPSPSSALTGRAPHRT